MATDTIDHVETAQMPPKKRKARWNLGTTLRDVGVRQMLMVIADEKSSHAAVCKASALLLRVEAQNQKDEQRKKKGKSKKCLPAIFLGREQQSNAECGTRNAEVRQESGDRSQESVTRSQEAAEEMSNGRVEPSLSSERNERARRWNIKPGYRDAMVRRWAMILVDAEASPTVKFAVMSLMVRAEAQNQKDEEYRRKKKNRGPKQIVVGVGRLDARRPDSSGRTAASGATTQRPLDDLIDVDKESPVAAVPEPTNLGPQSWYATGPPARRG